MAESVPYLRFFGDASAEIMGTVFAENLADLLAKVDDGKGSFPCGFMHTSTIPHEGTCYYDQVWARDAGRGVQELARLGFVSEAETVVDYFLSHKNFGDHWGRLIDRKVKEDYELDGNTHILNGIVQTWIASGKNIELGRRYVAECHEVFEWMQRCMDACPIGDLIPCQSELAGNPCGDGPVYAIYPNYGAGTAMASFAAMANDCGLAEEAAFLKNLQQRLMRSVSSVLTSDGRRETKVPRGVWLNGLTPEGKPYEEANFDARFAIHHWTRQLPFIQESDTPGFTTDSSVKETNKNSYAYIRHEMAKGEYFRKYGFVSNTCFTGAGGRHDDTMCGYGQNYFTQAALYMDDVNTYGKCLEGIARLAYDGNVIEPLSFEMSPFILHECFSFENYERALDHTFGTYADPARHVADNPGDEGNLVQACETLKTLSSVVGLSVRNGVLFVCPRLPWLWQGMELKNYPVYDEKGTCYRISMTYTHERWLRQCRLTVTESDGLKKAKVRFGPFPKVISTKNNLSDYTAEVSENATFLWHEGGMNQSVTL